MKKVFITGITGFAGSFLAEHLVSLGHDVSGTYISDKSVEYVDAIKDKIRLHKVNLLEADTVKNIIKEEQPEWVFHLAALTAPGLSFDNPTDTMTNNIAAEIHLFEALRKADLLASRVLITSSAEVYGIVAPNDLPIDEDTPLRPTTPYAVSKIAQDYLGLQYFLSYKMPIVRVRPFNHIGPRQSDAFAIGAFAKKIAMIEKGKMEPILKVGNTDAKRDFTDVRDMVRAYALVLENGIPSEVYNIGSGVSHKIADVLDMMLKESTTSITVETDESLLRPVENPELICDATKVRDATRWMPVIPLEQTLKDTLDYWRGIV